MKKTGFLFLLFLLVTIVDITAQNTRSAFANTAAANRLVSDSSVAAKKWFISSYVGTNSGIAFFNGGNASVFSVPVGIQLNRRLTNNWYAFAGISAAPSYINFNHSFASANMPKTWQGNSVFNNSSFNFNSRAEMGLMYTNDKKTFSISGSIGIEKNSYPWLLPATGAALRPIPMQY